MTAIILDGKIVSNQIYVNLESRIKKLKDNYNIVPGLATILVGYDPASKRYIKTKQKMCKKHGIYSEQINLDENIAEQYLKSIIFGLSIKANIHAILVQVPLPKQINQFNALNSIPPHMDVDGFHKTHVANLWRNQNYITPCTPKGIIRMLQFYNLEIAGKHAVVVGRGMTAGAPMSAEFLNRNATTTICHLGTKYLAQFTRQAEILVVATGNAYLITPDMVSEDAIVIDVGINQIFDKNKKSGYKIVGDVHPRVEDKVKYFSRVPGGVGLTTIASLLENTVYLAELSTIKNKRKRIF